MDTSSIIDLEYGKDADLATLDKWDKEGLIEIVKTDVVDTERMGRVKPSAVKEDVGTGVYEHSRYEHAGYDSGLRYDENTTEIKEDIGTAVIDNSRVGHAKVGTGGERPRYEPLLLVLFPETKGYEKANKNQIRDAMALTTHMEYNRDYFVTTDRDFLNKKEELKAKFNVVVFNPKECVEELKKSLDPI